MAREIPRRPCPRPSLIHVTSRAQIVRPPCALFILSAFIGLFWPKPFAQPRAARGGQPRRLRGLLASSCPSAGDANVRVLAGNSASREVPNPSLAAPCRWFFLPPPRTTRTPRRLGRYDSGSPCSVMPFTAPPRRNVHVSIAPDRFENDGYPFEVSPQTGERVRLLLVSWSPIRRRMPRIPVLRCTIDLPSSPAGTNSLPVYRTAWRRRAVRHAETGPQDDEGYPTTQFSSILACQSKKATVIPLGPQRGTA